MGWTETCALDQRIRFVLTVDEKDESFAQICRRFGISRRTGYKWLERYREAKFAGLQDRSRAPHHHPQGLSEAISTRCLAVRRTHPTWGPAKVRGYLDRLAPETKWPAVSTIGELFDREGLTVKRKFRRRTPHSPLPFAACEAPNDLWCMDFKGWFRTGDGDKCEPFTLSDAYSRFLLRCQSVPSTGSEEVWPIFEAALREFGLPKRLRSDNGPPFASMGAGGLTRFAVKVIKAGIMPERIKPGKPQQNGRLERLHLTLLKDTANPPARSLRQQAARFRRFQRLYNEERPHQALQNDTPADHFVVSPRSWNGVLRSPEYDGEEVVRQVRVKGEIKWRGEKIYISEALTGEPIALREEPDGSFAVRYGPIMLGAIDYRGDRLRRMPKRSCGFVDEGRTSPTTPQVQHQEQT